MIVGLGFDAAGYALKGAVADHLASRGVDVREFGPEDPAHAQYSAHYAAAVCRAIIAGEICRGVLICGTGTGISIAANKVDGIRAAVCSEPLTARLTRERNGSQVIAFGSEIIGQRMAFAIVDSFLDAQFLGDHDAKYADRFDQIGDIERAQRSSSR